jgi:hypothetical protein
VRRCAHPVLVRQRFVRRRQGLAAAAHRHQDPAGMLNVEQVDQRFLQRRRGFQVEFLQKASCGRVELLTHQQQQALHPHAVALPEGRRQLGIRGLGMGLQPMLKMVDDDQQLRGNLTAAPFAAATRGSDQSCQEVSVESREPDGQRRSSANPKSDK